MALPPVRAPIQPAGAVAGNADTGRLAAQKAFFQAALGASSPAAAQTPAAAPQAVPAQPRPQQVNVAATGTLPEEPPKKILRPGSLLDIRV